MRIWVPTARSLRNLFARYLRVLGAGLALAVVSAAVLALLYGVSGDIAWRIVEDGPARLRADHVGLSWELWGEHSAGGPRYERVKVGWPAACLVRAVELTGEPPVPGTIRIRPDRSASEWLLRDISMYRVSTSGLIVNGVLFAVAIDLLRLLTRKLQLLIRYGRCPCCGYSLGPSGSMACPECGALTPASNDTARPPAAP